MRSILLLALFGIACSTVVPVTDGGSSGGGSTAGGSTAGGSTAGGSTAGGSTAGGSTAGGSTAGGSTAGGSTAGGAAGGSAVCAPLEAAYLRAVEASKRCPLNALVNPCTVTRPNVVGCGCPTFIEANSGAPVDAIQNQYTDAGCVMTACPRCAPLDAGTCVPFDGGTVNEGVCIDLR